MHAATLLADTLIDLARTLGWPAAAVVIVYLLTTARRA